MTARKTTTDVQSDLEWYRQSPAEVFSAFDTAETGLSKDEASDRLERYGKNTLPEGRQETVFGIFFRQFSSPLIAILFVAAIVVFARGETLDGAIILFVLLFNAVVGTIQEGRAKNTLSALKTFATGSATVLRNGKETILSDEEVVPGDILLLHEGEKIPADARVVLSHNLRIEQAGITGESVPTHKEVDAIDTPNISLSDQRNMIFRGSLIVSGSGSAVVVATGQETVVGSLSKRISEIRTEIPLEREVKILSRGVAVGVILLTAIIFAVGVSMGKPIGEMFSVVVSLSVSVVPEGLPIVLTLVLATGMWRMSQHRVLVKRLNAVEALGQIDVLAVDKTGTITENKLVIDRAFVDGKTYEIGGSGYEPEGTIHLNGATIDPANHRDVLFLGKLAALSGDAKLVYSDESREWLVSGDPTEAALLVFAKKSGFHKDALEDEMPRVAESPFDYHTKLHASMHRADEGAFFLAVTGAPEEILSRAKLYWKDGEPFPISVEKRKEFELELLRLSRAGLRVVGAAYRESANASIELADAGLVFVGFYGMKDALRVGVSDAAARVRKAGVRLVMITGDNRVTAEVIAREAGIFNRNDHILSGDEVERMTDEDIAKQLDRVTVFARVTPEHKLRIIQAYRAAGKTIAMTGDGVNDSPSLVAADVGVSMGRIGTEVAKEASDVVLLDDRFENILQAMEEGRNIYRKIRQVITFLFSTNVAELLTILISILLGMPLPLLATQIIWVNLVADGFLDVALAMEPKEKHLLGASSRFFTKSLIDRTALVRMAVMAIPMTIGTLWLFSESLARDGIEKGWTMALTSLVVFHWFNVWNCRREERSVFQLNPFSNRYLLGALAIIISLQLAALYHPVLQTALHTVPLSLGEWGMILLVASSILVAEETRKFFYRRFAAALSPAHR